MPSLSPTMTHGTVAAWKKKPGDSLSAGDVMCEIDTDKASVALEVQDDGVLAKILVDALGSELLVGSTIALTVDDNEAYKTFLSLDPSSYSALLGSGLGSVAAPTAITPAPMTAAQVTQRLSPAASHMVNSKNIDISAVKGTSKGGLISKSDLVLALKSGVAKTGGVAKAAPLPVAAVSLPTSPQPAPVALPSFVHASIDSVDLTHGGIPVNDKYVDIPNTNMRKIIAKRLTESKAQVPHFYASIECEIDNLLKLRKTLKKDLDLNVSVNDLVIKSAALALRDVPEANAKWNKATSRPDLGSSVDISVAVATPNGLITPIVTDADKRGLSDISTKVKDLAGRAKEGKLKPEEYQGGSFSISNLGMFGITSFSAVINPPQACILAVGGGVPRVVPGTAKPKVVTIVTVQLSGDRRVVDEALASQFLKVFQSYLSNPKTMML